MNNPTLRELERIQKIAESQGIRAMKSILSGMPNKVMRERLEFQQMIFYGAPVISIEGEEFQQGARVYRNVGFLGYFINMEEFVDSWRLWFTTPTGMKFDRRGYPIKNEDYVLHPLCADGQFVVPKDGGITLLDDGNLILVSRTGLLRGEGGWALAQKYAQRWRELMVAYQQKSSRIEELSQYVDQINSENSRLQAEKNALLEIVRDVQAKYRLVMTNYNRFLVEKDTLMAQLRGMHDVNANLRQNLETTCANLQKQIDDILTIVDTEAIEDSLRANLSIYPKIPIEKTMQMKKKWRDSGIIEEDERDKVIKELQEKLKEQEQIIQQLRQQEQEQSPSEEQQEETPPAESQKGFTEKLREGAKRVKEQSQQESESENEESESEEEEEQ